MKNLIALISLTLVMMLSSCGGAVKEENVTTSADIYAGSGILSWSTPTQYTDGSPLTAAYFKIYYANSPDGYDPSAYREIPAPAEPASTMSVSVRDLNLPKNKYYFVVTTCDPSNFESDYSNPTYADLTQS